MGNTVYGIYWGAGHIVYHQRTSLTCYKDNTLIRFTFIIMDFVPFDRSAPLVEAGARSNNFAYPRCFSRIEHNECLLSDVSH